MSRKTLIYCLCGLLVLAFATSVWSQAQVPAQKAPAAAVTEKKPAAATAPEKSSGIPQDKKKHTKLGLYVTAKEAYAMWQKDQGKIKVLDCRTPEEYAFLGHAPMAVNVPFQFMVYRWNPEKKSYAMKDNAKFIRQAKKVFSPTDTILVMCRSGHRSAKTVDALTKAGFKTVYNISDGFEGDAVKDKKDPNFGKRTINGWKNAGAPWTYELDTNLIYLEGKPRGN